MSQAVQAAAAPAASSSEAAAAQTTQPPGVGAGPPGPGDGPPAFASVLDDLVARTAVAEGQNRTAGESGGQRAPQGSNVSQDGDPAPDLQAEAGLLVVPVPPTQAQERSAAAAGEPPAAGAPATLPAPSALGVIASQPAARPENLEPASAMPAPGGGQAAQAQAQAQPQSPASADVPAAPASNAAAQPADALQALFAANAATPSQPGGPSQPAPQAQATGAPMQTLQGQTPQAQPGLQPATTATPQGQPVHSAQPLPGQPAAPQTSTPNDNPQPQTRDQTAQTTPSAVRQPVTPQAGDSHDPAPRAAVHSGAEAPPISAPHAAAVTETQPSAAPAGSAQAPQSQPTTAPIVGRPTPPAGYGVRLDRALETVRTTIEIGARQGFSQAKIQLAPASLGEITIHLQRTADGVVARVVADHAAAAQTLAQGGDDLRRSLNSAGLTLLSLDIEARGDRRDSAGQPGQSTRSGAVRDEQDVTATEADAHPKTTLVLPNGALVNVLA